jgi:hypothetical protein
MQAVLFALAALNIQYYQNGTQCPCKSGFTSQGAMLVPYPLRRDADVRPTAASVALAARSLQRCFTVTYLCVF